MKKYLGFLLLLVCILPLTGCLKKDAIDVEKFTTEMEGRGFNVDTVTTANNAPVGMRVAYVATKSGLDYKVELYTFDGESNAKTAFNNQQTTLTNTKGGNYTETNISGLNYNTYTLNNSSNYFYMVRVEDKLIYGYGPSSDKDDIKDIMKALGY